jgi:hypothetical protein
MKLSPATSISLLDYFAPTDWATLNSKDLDLGSTEPVVLNSNYLFQIGKEGIGYMLNADNLGHIAGQLYSSQVCGTGNGAYGGLAYSNPYLIVPCTKGLVVLTVNLGSNPSNLLYALERPKFPYGPTNHCRKRRMGRGRYGRIDLRTKPNHRANALPQNGLPRVHGGHYV